MKAFLLTMFLVAAGGSLQGAPIFTQCPAVGLNTGCEFLITLTPAGTFTLSADPNAPNNIPYGGSDDTLIGVLNSSTATLTALPLSSSLALFAFDGDGPCTQTPGPKNCSTDPSGYGGPGVTFSGINAAKTAGTVNFGPGLAPGGSTWFALEPPLSAGQLTLPAGPATVPEPTSAALLLAGLGGAAVFLRRRSA